MSKRRPAPAGAGAHRSNELETAILNLAINARDASCRMDARSSCGLENASSSRADEGGESIPRFRQLSAPTRHGIDEATVAGFRPFFTTSARRAPGSAVAGLRFVRQSGGLVNSCRASASHDGRHSTCPAMSIRGAARASEDVCPPAAARRPSRRRGRNEVRPSRRGSARPRLRVLEMSDDRRRRAAARRSFDLLFTTW